MIFVGFGFLMTFLKKYVVCSVRDDFSAALHFQISIQHRKDAIHCNPAHPVFP